MPTGYAVGIEDGMEFKYFVLRCARAFGIMRDDSSDAEIPNEWKSEPYYLEKVEESRCNLIEIQSITLFQATHKALEVYNTEVDRIAKRKQEILDLEKKYQKRLKQVEAWNPPTTDHNRLKEFMIDQINEAIKLDCSLGNFIEPKLLTGEEWLAQQREWYEKDIEYYQEQYDKSVERVNNRTKWVQALKKSLE